MEVVQLKRYVARLIRECHYKHPPWEGKPLRLKILIQSASYKIKIFVGLLQLFHYVLVTADSQSIRVFG